MIVKGNQRGGGQNLATHLMNSRDNERVEVADVRGAVARDLHGAFAEWFATSKATNCRKYLYSLSISPDQRQGRLTRDQYAEFINRTERTLRLQDNSRVVVFHVKDGREHCHVVWSRIDTDKMKAVQISHDRQKLRLVVRDFARQHGLELPEGLKNDRNSKRFSDRARQSNHAEMQQEERSGITKEERRKEIAAAWHATRTGEEFIEVLARGGYHLARGDQRDYVIIDQFGEVHSLSRQLRPAVKSKEMEARLADLPQDRIPSVDAAREQARRWCEDRLKSIQKQVEGPSPAQLREELRAAHDKRRAGLDGKRDSLMERQKAERETIAGKHHRHEQDVAERREASTPRGLLAFLGKITGINALIAYRQKKQDLQRAEMHGAELDALDRRHERERAEFQRHYRALARVEKREAQSLEIAIRREAFQRAARPLAKAQQHPKLREDFNRQAVPPPSAVRPFNEAARPEPRIPELAKDFSAAARNPDPAREAEKTKGTRQRPRDAFADAARDPAKDRAKEKPRPADSLARRFEDAQRKEPANDERKETPREKRRNRGPDLER